MQVKISADVSLFSVLQPINQPLCETLLKIVSLNHRNVQYQPFLAGRWFLVKVNWL